MPVSSSAGFSHQGDEPVVVTTYMGLSAKTEAQFRDIAIYVNPAESMGWLGTSGFGRLHRARVFGLIPYGLQPPSPVREFVAAVFGEDLVSVPRHGWIARPVQVVFVPSRLQANLIPDEDDLAVRRRAVWHHPVRNRRIASLAKLLAAGDGDELKKDIPGLAKVRFRRRCRPGGRARGQRGARVGLAAALRLAAVDEEGVLTDGLSRCDTCRLTPKQQSASDLPQRDRHHGGHAGGRHVRHSHSSRCRRRICLPYDHHLLGHPSVDDDRPAADRPGRSPPSPGPKVDAGTQGGLLGDRLERHRRAPGGRPRSSSTIPARIRQPVLAYQTPHPRRLVEGEVRTAEYNYQRAA